MRIAGAERAAPMVFVAAGLVAQWTGIVDFGAATHGEGLSHEALFLVARRGERPKRRRLPFLMLFIALAAADEGLEGGWLRFALEQLGLAVFFSFGVFAADALGDTTWQIVAYALLSLTVVRMAPVAIAGLGLRGLASIIRAFVVVEEAPGLTGRGSRWTRSGCSPRETGPFPTFSHGPACQLA